MKASELVVKLQAAIEEHGPDIDVVFENDEGDCCASVGDMRWAQMSAFQIGYGNFYTYYPKDEQTPVLILSRY